MRPVVALLSARPETIAEDYRRLFELAGLNPLEQSGPLILAAEARNKSWIPGTVCSPWQLEAVCQSLAGAREDEGIGPQLLPVGDSGPLATFSPREKGWSDILERFSLQPMKAEQLAAVPYRPDSLLPALEGSLPQGLRLSPHFRGKNLMLLSALELGPGGDLRANLSLLTSLLVAKIKAEGRIPQSEILAEIVGLAREVFQGISAVTDATVLSVARRGGVQLPLVRNLLIAGTDPVAVDSTLTKLAGLKPADSPWLRLCQDRGLGVADPARIKIVGEPEWLDLDFKIPEDTFATGMAASRWMPKVLLNQIPGFKAGVGARPLESAWDRLFRDFQSGVTS
jgi:hypothetical protein